MSSLELVANYNEGFPERIVRCNVIMFFRSFRYIVFEAVSKSK